MLIFCLFCIIVLLVIWLTPKHIGAAFSDFRSANLDEKYHLFSEARRLINIKYPHHDVIDLELFSQKSHARKPLQIARVSATVLPLGRHSRRIRLNALIICGANFEHPATIVRSGESQLLQTSFSSLAKDQSFKNYLSSLKD